jgi:hypothetical protein
MFCNQYIFLVHYYWNIKFAPVLTTRRIYLIHNPNNLCLSLSPHLLPPPPPPPPPKKPNKHCYVNVIHMHKFAVCTHLLFCTWLVSLLVNYSHIFLCFVVTQWFCPVCIKHHSCIWLGIRLFWFKTFILRVMLDMFYNLFIVIVDT